MADLFSTAPEVTIFVRHSPGCSEAVTKPLGRAAVEDICMVLLTREPSLRFGDDDERDSPSNHAEVFHSSPHRLSLRCASAMMLRIYSQTAHDRKTAFSDARGHSGRVEELADPTKSA